MPRAPLVNIVWTRARLSRSSAISGSRTYASGCGDADVFFGSLSKTIYRGYKFDRMFPSDSPSPDELLQLDHLAMVSLKTQMVPHKVQDRVVRLLRDFGQKRPLERYGRFMMKKIRSRTSSEVPRVSPSMFLPDEDDHENEHGAIAKLRRNPAFKDLFAHADISSLADSTMSRLAIANKEDRRHKLYQMFWSPEAALTYVPHRYPAVWAANLRVMREVSFRAPDFQPTRVLDYGAGPAPSLAVAEQLWPKSLEHVVGVEPSENMTQVGQYLTDGIGLPPVKWQRTLYDNDEKYDLVVASYVQMEVLTWTEDTFRRSEGSHPATHW